MMWSALVSSMRLAKENTNKSYSLRRVFPDAQTIFIEKYLSFQLDDMHALGRRSVYLFGSFHVSTFAAYIPVTPFDNLSFRFAYNYRPNLLHRSFQRKRHVIKKFGRSLRALLVPICARALSSTILTG
jgi:hypothetical protein